MFSTMGMTKSRKRENPKGMEELQEVGLWNYRQNVEYVEGYKAWLKRDLQSLAFIVPNIYGSIEDKESEAHRATTSSEIIIVRNAKRFSPKTRGRQTHHRKSNLGARNLRKGMRELGMRMEEQKRSEVPDMGGEGSQVQWLFSDEPVCTPEHHRAIHERPSQRRAIQSISIIFAPASVCFLCIFLHTFLYLPLRGPIALCISLPLNVPPISFRFVYSLKECFDYIYEAYIF